MNNFSGKASEFIDYYYENLKEMDSQVTRNFSTLMDAILASKDVLYLIDLYSDLGCVVQEKGTDIAHIKANIKKRNDILSYNRLDEYSELHNCSRGDALVELSRGIREAKIELESKKDVKEGIERFNHKLETSIYERVYELSPDEMEEFTQKFNKKVSNVEENISTLHMEIVRRRKFTEEEKIGRDIEKEIADREDKINELSQYKSTYESFYMLINNKKNR